MSGSQNNSSGFSNNRETGGFQDGGGGGTPLYGRQDFQTPWPTTGPVTPTPSDAGDFWSGRPPGPPQGGPAGMYAGRPMPAAAAPGADPRFPTNAAAGRLPGAGPTWPDRSMAPAGAGVLPGVLPDPGRTEIDLVRMLGEWSDMGIGGEASGYWSR